MAVGLALAAKASADWNAARGGDINGRVRKP
jgi:hypothetical protein